MGPGTTHAFDGRSSIAACIAADPRTEAVFAAWGLHRCCAGKATLSEAAVIAGVPLARLLDALDVVVAGGDPPPPAADRHGCAVAVPPEPRPAIGPGSMVADVIETWPETLQVLIDAGFTPLRNPLLRRTLATKVTLARACSMQGIDLESLLARLRRAAQASEP